MHSKGNFVWLLPVRLLCFSCFLSLEFALLSPSYSHGLHLSHVSIYTVHSPFLSLSSPLPSFTFPLRISCVCRQLCQLCEILFVLFLFLLRLLLCVLCFARVARVAMTAANVRIRIRIAVAVDNLCHISLLRVSGRQKKTFSPFPQSRDAILMDNQLCYRILTNCSFT